MVGAIRQHPWCQEGAREYTLYQNACISYVTGDRCPNGGHGTIPVRTLDSYQLRGVAVVKVDVEGNEPAVLRGAVATLCRWRPTVWAECADRDVTDLAAVLKPLGYRVTRIYGATPMTVWEPR